MNKKEVMVILNDIRSRENVGSIFRTADGAGVSKIYLCGITPTPPHEKISKTALGAESSVPWEYKKQTYRVLSDLKNRGYKIIALEQTKKSVDIFTLSSLDSRPLALVLGNEVRGLSPKILSYCDDIVHIPMYGKKESLNVSVAAGIALYQIKNAKIKG